MLKVVAIVLNYNSSNECICLFNNLTQYSQKISEILIIDNASTIDDIENLKKNIPSKNLLFNHENLGYAGGNNIAIQKALDEKADFIWLLNPDIRVNKDSLSILVETMQNDSSLAAVGPRILHREDPKRIFSDGEKMIMDDMARTFHKNHNLEVALAPQIIDYDVDYIDGSSILLNTNAIRDIGKLPEEYFLYFEETDWCFKARKHNWKLAVNTKSEVFNLTSLKGSVFHYYFIRNKLIFCKKYHPDFSEVRKFYMKDLGQQIISRFNGKFLRPHFRSHLEGLISGLIKTIF